MASEYGMQSQVSGLNCNSHVTSAAYNNNPIEVYIPYRTVVLVFINRKFSSALPDATIYTKCTLYCTP